jgi:hypothetical protein
MATQAGRGERHALGRLGFRHHHLDGVVLLFHP